MGDSVTLTATPASDYAFAGWSGGYGTVNPLTIAVDSDISVTATFGEAVTLTLASTGTTASLTTVPAGPIFATGTSVTVTAPDVPGYVFDGWKENGSWVGSSQSSSCTWTMNADRTLTAQYTANTTTILAYMDGDNDLDAYAFADINEMEAADLRGTGINVVALYDRATTGEWRDTRTYRIKYQGSATPDTSILSQRVACAPLGITEGGSVEVNMGDPATLSAFIGWGKQAYPAAQNMLIFWNHGSGWRSAAKAETASAFGAEGASLKLDFTSSGKSAVSSGLRKALCQDETNSGILYTSDLGDVIPNGSFDVIGFDLCLAGMIEVAYEIRNKADYMIASEETTPGDGWEYQNWLPDFAAKSTKTAYELVDSVVDAFAVHYASEVGATMAGYDLTRIDGLFSALNGFSSALSAYIVSTAAQQTVSDTLFFEVEKFFDIPGDLNIDVWDMADKVNASVAGMTAVSSSLKAAVEAVVIKEWHNTEAGWRESNTDAHGIAIHLVALDADGIASGHQYGYFADHAILAPDVGYIPSFVDASDNAWVPNFTRQSGLLYDVWYKVFP